MASQGSARPYDAFYYAHSCGQPYQRDDVWLNFFASVAERIVSDIRPTTVLDAGCAMGFLVEALRDRGVDAGGVDISEADNIPTPKTKKYEAVFMARFHPQKAPLIAVSVWKEFVLKNSTAKLAMIGNGPQEEEVKQYIKENNLSKNVDFFGFEGQELTPIHKLLR